MVGQGWLLTLNHYFKKDVDYHTVKVYKGPKEREVAKEVKNVQADGECPGDNLRVSALSDGLERYL